MRREYDRPIIPQVQCLWNCANPLCCCSNRRPSLRSAVTAVVLPGDVCSSGTLTVADISYSITHPWCASARELRAAARLSDDVPCIREC